MKFRLIIPVLAVLICTGTFLLSPPSFASSSTPSESVDYVNDAGLVITSPFLPALFRQLGLLDSGSKFKDEASSEKAMRALEFILTGDNGKNFKPSSLEKILVGRSHSEDLVVTHSLTHDEMTQIDHLLDALIKNWRAIGQSSHQALRETFLRREGRLTGFQLKVQRRSIDVLLDRIPWSFSVIHQPWMSETLRVDWS